MSSTPSMLSPGSSPSSWIHSLIFISVSQNIVLDLLFSLHTLPGESHPFLFLQFYPILMSSMSMPWLSPDIQFHIYICIHNGHLKLYVSLNPSLWLPLICILPAPHPVLQQQHPPNLLCLIIWTNLWFIFTNRHRKLPIKSWRFLHSSTSCFDCFSITTYFGPSFILSGCTKWHSLSTLCLQLHVANIQQAPSSNRADHELQVLIDKGPASFV